MKLNCGQVQVYTGNGKGKSTAALGQGLRACGRGLKVTMVQFFKSGDSGELHSIEKLHPLFEIHRFDRPRGFFWTLTDEEKVEQREDVEKALDFVRETMDKDLCDVLILDELLGVINVGLFDVEELIGLIKKRPVTMEVILTGRNAPQILVDFADLVTEMKEIKHYFIKGLPARCGIED